MIEKVSEGSDTVLAGFDTINLSDAPYAKVENAAFVYTGGGGSLSFNATGNAAANVLVGGTLGADTLTGLDGNDRLDGGEMPTVGGNHADVLVGGKGSDTYVVRNGLEVIDETGGLTTDKDTVESWIAGFGLDTRGNSGMTNTRTNLENVTIKGGVAGQDRWASGNESVNILTGGITDDLLDGGWKYSTTDADMEISDGVVDTLIGGLGDDSYVIRDTKDRLVELADSKTLIGQGIDTVILDIAADVRGTGSPTRSPPISRICGCRISTVRRTVLSPTMASATGPTTTSSETKAPTSSRDSTATTTWLAMVAPTR